MTAGLLKLALVTAAFSVSGCDEPKSCINGLFNIAKKPRGWPCHDPIPPPQDNTYPTTSWAELQTEGTGFHCPVGLVGWDMEFAFLANSEVAIQHVKETVSAFTCAGDGPIQQTQEFLEYFVLPGAFDVQAEVGCCNTIKTWERAGKISFITFNDFQAMFGFALPKVIPIGMNALAIDSKLNAQVTLALMAQIMSWVDNCPLGITWVLRSEMDSCLVNGALPTQSANTICSKPYCFQVGWDDGAGDSSYQLFQSPP
jgi:hypothetical protein